LHSTILILFDILFITIKQFYKPYAECGNNPSLPISQDHEDNDEAEEKQVMPDSKNADQFQNNIGQGTNRFSAKDNSTVINTIAKEATEGFIAGTVATFVGGAAVKNPKTTASLIEGGVAGGTFMALLAKPEREESSQIDRLNKFNEGIIQKSVPNNDILNSNNKGDNLGTTTAQEIHIHNHYHEHKHYYNDDKGGDEEEKFNNE
jgi:hypothetical protein